MRFVALGVMPLGALVGGALASAWGPRAALWVCAAGFLSLPPLLLLSPFRSRGTGRPSRAPPSPEGPLQTTAARMPARRGASHVSDSIAENYLTRYRAVARHR
ncbi:hypothetical protein SALBM311S_09847 [Streptomyces alboniger]